MEQKVDGMDRKIDKIESFREMEWMDGYFYGVMYGTDGMEWN